MAERDIVERLDRVEYALGDRISAEVLVEAQGAVLAAKAEITRLRTVMKEAEGSLNLALKYWADRQQRYKNRHPIWVGEARAVLLAMKEPKQ